MITQYTITNAAWTAITSAGEGGSCWLDEEGNGSKGRADVRITHSATGVPADSELTKARKVYRPSGNSDVVLFTADSSSDIFYARCKHDGDEVILTVDAI